MRALRPLLQAPVACGCVAFATYLCTLAPGQLGHDFAEFQYLPARLGLPHPNGFPLYMLLGWLWSRLPLGSLALRMNLFSAVAAALASALFAWLLQALGARAAAAAAGGLLFAFQPFFWLYATAAERFGLAGLLLCPSLLVALQLAQTGSTRAGAWCGLLVGLGLSTHPFFALWAPCLLAYLALSCARRRRWQPVLAAVTLLWLAVLSLYAYVPWRWQALAKYPLTLGRSEAIWRGLAFVWYSPELDWTAVRSYIAGLGGYAAGFGWPALQALCEQWPFFAATWLAQWPLALLPLALVGSARLVRRWPLFFLCTLALAVLDLLATAYIRQGKVEGYLLPAFTVFSLWVGLGVDWLLLQAERLQLDRLASLCLLGVVLALAAVRWEWVPAKRGGDPGAWWREVLSYPVEEGAAFLAHWGDLTPMWYLQQAEGLRPDVLGLFPPDEGLAEEWLAQGRPLYLAGPLHGWAPALPQSHALVPWGKLIRVVRREEPLPELGFLTPCEEPPGWPVEVRGWALRAAPGAKGMALLFLHWRSPGAIPAGLWVRARLLPLEGELSLASCQEPLLVSWYPQEAIPLVREGLAAVPIRLPSALPPAAYRLEVALSLEGRQRWPGAEQPLWLGPVRLPEPASACELSRGDWPNLFRPKAGPLRLRAFRLSGQAVRPGDPFALELLWQADAAPAADYLVSFQLWDLRGPVAETEPQPLFPGYPTAWWAAGECVRGIYSLQAPPGLGSRWLWVEVLLHSPWGRQSFWPVPAMVPTPLRVRDRPHACQLPAGVRQVRARFGDVAALEGYALERCGQGAPKELVVRLYWRALQTGAKRSYTVFVHLLDEAGNIASQHDGPPAMGELPTTIWVAGEIIADEHRLSLPQGLRPGRYRIVVGLYDPATMARLRLEGGQDALALAELEL